MAEGKSYIVLMISTIPDLPVIMNQDGYIEFGGLDYDIIFKIDLINFRLLKSK